MIVLRKTSSTLNLTFIPFALPDRELLFYIFGVMIPELISIARRALKCP